MSLPSGVGVRASAEDLEHECNENEIGCVVDDDERVQCRATTGHLAGSQNCLAFIVAATTDTATAALQSGRLLLVKTVIRFHTRA